MKRNFLSLLSLGLVILLVIFACKKEEEDETDVDTDTLSAIDNTKASEAESSTMSTVNHYGINEEQIKSMQDFRGNPSISLEVLDTTDGWPKKLTIDFGTGVICNDGRTRKGQFIAEFSGHWHPDSISSNNNVKVSFVDYFVNNVERKGEYIITYQGTPNNGPKYTIEANNAELIFANNDVISWSSVQTTEWIEGHETDTVLTDDVYIRTGNRDGVNRKGLSYSANIEEDLRLDQGCEYVITSGKLSITPEGKEKRTIDYGDGNCDNSATLSVSGVSIDFKF